MAWPAPSSRAMEVVNSSQRPVTMCTRFLVIGFFRNQLNKVIHSILGRGRPTLSFGSGDRSPVTGLQGIITQQKREAAVWALHRVGAHKTGY